MERSIDRPFGVILIALLLAVNGVVALMSAVGAFGVTASVVGIAVGLAMLFLAYGMWTLRRWAWTGTMAVAVLSLIAALVMLFAVPGVISAWFNMVLSGVIIVYLVSPGVRDAFGGRLEA